MTPRATCEVVTTSTGNEQPYGNSQKANEESSDEQREGKGGTQ